MSVRKLGEILVQHKLITGTQLVQALEEQRGTKDFLGALLVKKGWVTEDALMRVLSEQSGIALVSVKDIYVNWRVSCRFSGLVSHERKFFPFKEDDYSVTVAISNPLDVASIEKLENYVAPKKIKLVLVFPSELEDLIRQCDQRSKSALRNLIDKGD